VRIYYDTEFIEDGHTIDLISIGMVREDGRSYYAISEEFSRTNFCRHEWLVQNVAPSLPITITGPEWFNWDINHPDFADVKNRLTIAQEVEEFIVATPNPELWAWYGAYDHVALCQLWGPMSAIHDRGIPMFTNDLKQEANRLGNPWLPEQEGGEHNALDDAIHNKVRGNFLETFRSPYDSLHK